MSGAAAAPPPPGLTGGFADYHVGDLIGFGQLGPLYAGRYLPSGAPVQLERIAQPLRQRSGFADRLAAEARRAAGIRDTAVLAVYDLLDDGSGGLYLAGEAPDGELLVELAPEGLGLDVASATEWTDGVLAGLDMLHAAGSAHGAVSRRTVLRGAGGRVRLQGVPSAALAAEVAGQQPSAAGDLAAAGALLRGLLEGPRAPGERPRTVPRRLEAAVLGRFDSAAAMRSALGGAGPADAALEHSRSGRRPRLLGAALAFGAVAAGVLLGFGLNALLGSSAGSGSLRVSSVTVDVNPGAACDSVYRFTAVGNVSGHGSLVYRWVATGGGGSGERTLAIADGTRSFAVTESWKPPATLAEASISFELDSPTHAVITRSVTPACP